VSDVLVGLLAILAGAVLCFRGYLTMRVIIPIWGAFAGFMLGAGAVSAVTDDGLLSTLVGWVTGAVVALVFAALAYLYFEVSVFLAMASIGFVLGSSLMVALDVHWTWVIVLAGIVVGGVLAWFAIVGNLPMIALTVLTSMAGASTIVAGIMLLGGVFDVDDLDDVSVVEQINDAPGWWALYVLLAVAGIVVQVRLSSSLTTSLRDEWATTGRRPATR
jgi:hypothetical protein